MADEDINWLLEETSTQSENDMPDGSSRSRARGGDGSNKSNAGAIEGGAKPSPSKKWKRDMLVIKGTADSQEGVSEPEASFDEPCSSQGDEKRETSY